MHDHACMWACDARGGHIWDIKHEWVVAPQRIQDKLIWGLTLQLESVLQDMACIQDHGLSLGASRELKGTCGFISCCCGKAGAAWWMHGSMHVCSLINSLINVQWHADLASQVFPIILNWILKCMIRQSSNSEECDLRPWDASMKWCAALCLSPGIVCCWMRSRKDSDAWWVVFASFCFKWLANMWLIWGPCRVNLALLAFCI